MNLELPKAPSQPVEEIGYIDAHGVERTPPAFAVGDIVQLVSGGSRMVVDGRNPDGSLHCVWFNVNDEPREADYPAVALVKSLLAFAVGDVVQFRGVGECMTVAKCNQDGSVRCDWISREGQPQSATHPGYALVKISRPPQAPASPEGSPPSGEASCRPPNGTRR